MSSLLWSSVAPARDLECPGLPCDPRREDGQPAKAAGPVSFLQMVEGCGQGRVPQPRLSKPPCPSFPPPCREGLWLGPHGIMGQTQFLGESTSPVSGAPRTCCPSPRLPEAAGPPQGSLHFPYLSEGLWSDVFVGRRSMNMVGGSTGFLSRASWASAWKPSSLEAHLGVGVAESLPGGHRDLPLLGWGPPYRTLRQVLRTVLRIQASAVQWNSAWRLDVLYLHFPVWWTLAESFLNLHLS